MPKGGMCCVCAHPRRDLVELGLVHRVPVRVIAKRFELSKDSLFRHRRLHMGPARSPPSRPRRTRPRSISSSSSGPRARACLAPSWASARGFRCSARWPSRPASSAPRPASSGRSPTRLELTSQAARHDRRPHLDHEHPDQRRLPSAQWRHREPPSGPSQRPRRPSAPPWPSSSSRPPGHR